MLAQPLTADTFHMTLHDLVNGSVHSEALARDMERVKDQVLPLLQIWQNEPPLQMRATRTFNLVHTSVVLGLERMQTAGGSWTGCIRNWKPWYRWATV